MPDLRESLAHYTRTLQPGETPPFAVVRERHRRRSRRRGIAGTAGAALVVAAGSIAVPHLTGTGEVVRPADEPPLPETITADGRTLHLQGPWPVVAARPGAGGSLVVSVDGPRPEDWDDICQPYVRVRVASQDARSVRLVAYNYAAPDPAVALCVARETSSERSITLQSALGDREVVDATGDRRLWPVERSSGEGGG